MLPKKYPLLNAMLSIARVHKTLRPRKIPVSKYELDKQGHYMRLTDMQC